MLKISLQQGTPEVQGKLPECPVHLMEQNSDYSESPFFTRVGPNTAVGKGGLYTVLQ